MELSKAPLSIFQGQRIAKGKQPPGVLTRRRRFVYWTNRARLGSLSEGIQRIRFTGETPFSLLNCSLTQEGFDLTFTKPVDPKSVSAGQIQAERYRYAYGYKYGGERSKKHPLKLRRLRSTGTIPGSFV